MTLSIKYINILLIVFFFSSLALYSQTNQIWIWGQNADGQLGDGTTIGKLTPTLRMTGSNWKDISTGADHNIGLKNDGTLWSWGLNNLGQLGIGNTTNSIIPLKIGTDNNWNRLSFNKAGAHHSFAIKNDGTLWGWGLNTDGQLGDATNANKNTPIKINNETNWDIIAPGEYHTIALKTDGTLWSWGRNNVGQLGQGNITYLNIPTKIGNSNDWKFIASGSSQSFAIKTDGSLWAWGYNIHGQLGIGNNLQKNEPTRIGTANDWIYIASGGNEFTIAIKSDGTMWSWGLNDFGQLGQGNNTNFNTPTKVGLSNNWNKVFLGFKYATALKTDGTLWTWGYNNVGQLGNGNTTNVNSPTQIGSNNKWKQLTAGAANVIALYEVELTQVATFSLPSNATYKAGENLDFIINWSSNVSITGTPRIAITIGSTTKYATYQSGSGTSSILFRYTVTTGDIDNDGIVISTNGLELNGGTINDVSNGEAILTLPVLSTSDIRIDGIIPFISDVSVPTNNTYVANENLEFTINWSENVTITGTPRIAITIGSTTKYATYQSGSGTTSILFRYTVANNDLDNNGIVVGSLELNGGTIKDINTNLANLTLNSIGSTTNVKVDAVAPIITSVNVPNSNNYVTNENLEFTINWSENITITGTPRIATTIGSSTKYATYQSGSGTSSILFTYTVESMDLDEDGINLGSLELNGGTIKDNNTNSANLTLNSIENTNGLKVNSSMNLAPEPTIQSKSITFHSITKNRIGLRWTKGNGNKRVVLTSMGTLNNAEYLLDGSGYTAGNFGVNTLPNNSNVSVVYNGDNTTCLVEGLARNTSYYFKIMEYNGENQTANYLQTTASSNPSSKKTNKKESEEEISSSLINVYPNPVNDVLNIEFNKDFNNIIDNAKLTIINEVGQEVYSTKNTNNLLTINTLDLVNGVYHIIISNDNESIYHSFVIER